MKRRQSPKSLRFTNNYGGRRTANTLRSVQLNGRSAAGVADPVSPPSQEAFRRFVLQGECPFCGAGPFTVLAKHTQAAHAVDKRDLCDLAGLMYSRSIMDPATKDERSEIARQRFLASEAMRTGLTTRRPTGQREYSLAAKERKAVYSPAGKEVQRQKAVAAHTSDPELRYRAGQAAGASKRATAMPFYEAAARVYMEVAAAMPRKYGRIRAVASQLGWKEEVTARRIRIATELGLVSADNTP